MGANQIVIKQLWLYETIISTNFAQLAGAVEYTDCTSSEG